MPYLTFFQKLFARRTGLSLSGTSDTSHPNVSPIDQTQTTAGGTPGAAAATKSAAPGENSKAVASTVASSTAVTLTAPLHCTFTGLALGAGIVHIFGDLVLFLGDNFVTFDHFICNFFNRQPMTCDEEKTVFTIGYQLFRLFAEET